MKTKITIRVYDIKWDKEDEGRMPPRQMLFNPEISTIEDGIRNCDAVESLIDEIQNHLSEKYPDHGYDSFEWCFV
jgi:hypothetical protein